MLNRAMGGMAKPLALVMLLLIIASFPASALKRPGETCDPAAHPSECGSGKCDASSHVCMASRNQEPCEAGGDCEGGQACTGGKCWCTANSQCHPTNKCDTASGKCTYKHVGERCPGGAVECSSYNCTGSPATCQEVCVGENCHEDSDCVTGKCLSGVVCGYARQGDTCTSDDDCEWALQCNGNIPVSTCDPRVPVGSPCGSNRKCSTNKCDSGGHCIASNAGEPCISGSDSDCAAGLKCIGRVCYQPIGTGAGPLTRYSPVLGDWVMAAGAAVLVAFLLVALAYMIGVGFRYPQVEQWARSEFWEAVLTLLMIGAVFFLAQFLSDVSYTLAGQDHFGAAFEYLVNTRAELLAGWASLLLAIQGFGMASGTSVSFFWFIPLIPIPPEATTWTYIRLGTSVSLAAGWGAIVSGLSPPLYMVYIALITNMGQDVILHFAKSDMLTVFLPLGILFRAFPLTRKIGGTIIALALALYFVFPLSLALNTYIYNLYAWPPNTAVVGNNPPAGSGWDLPTGTIVWLVDVLDWLFLWVVMILFLFILDLIITITAFRAIAEAVGGDPQIFGMGKLGI